VEFPWLTLIASRDNPGFAAGVNRAAQEAAGRYLLLLNPDCVFAHDVIRPLATWLDCHARVAVAGARIRNADGTLQASARRFPNASTAVGGRTTWLTRLWPDNPLTQRNLLGSDAADPLEVDWVSGACTLIRRTAFDEVGGLDEGFFLYWEDADLCLRLKKRGWMTIYHPGVEVTHLTGRSSAHAQRRSLIAFHRSAFRYFWKHAGPVGRLVSPFVLLGLQARLLLKMARLQLARIAR
jgi:GT2 family glycosyltransferase